MFLRKNKKHSKNDSIDDAICFDKTGNELKIADIFHTFQPYICKKIFKIIKTLKEQLDTTKPHIKKDLSPNTITKEDCQKLLNFLKTPAFSQMTEVLTVKEAVIVILNFGFIDGKYFSIEVIAKFLKIDIPEVLEAIRKGSLHKDNINLLKNNVLDEEPPKR